MSELPLRSDLVAQWHEVSDQPFPKHLDINLIPRILRILRTGKWQWDGTKIVEMEH